MGKPQVTLTLAGDESKLTQAFDRVGSSSKAMATSVGESSRVIAEESTSGFDRAAEGADNAEGKAQGFASTLTGTKDLMSATGEIARGNYFEGLVMAGQGAADLAEGLNYTVIPAVKAVAQGFIGQAAQTVRATTAAAGHRVAMIAGAGATRVMTVAQKGLNVAMRANPIGLIVTALILLGTGLVLAYKKSETFRTIVNGALNGVKVAFKAVVTAAQAVYTWVRDNAPKIGGFFKGVADAISAPFRAAFAGIRSAWNSTVGGKGFSIPGWVPNLGGKDFRIPYFHTGGIVSGAMGSETLAVLRAGERITAGSNQPTRLPPSGDIYVTVEMDGQQFDARIKSVTRKENRELKRKVKAA